MPLKQFNPTSPGRRFMTVLTFDDITKSTPEKALTEPMKQMVTITVKAARELGVAVNNLRKFNDPESIREPTLAVHTLENQADAVYRLSLIHI